MLNYNALGVIQKVKINDVWWYVYIPTNVNVNTETFVYSHGGSSMTDANDCWYRAGEYLEEYGSDNIVVMPVANNLWNNSANVNSANNSVEGWSSSVIDIVSDIQQHYGIENKSIISAGHSWGGASSLKISIENIKRNPNVEPQIIYLLDDMGLSVKEPVDSILANGGKKALFYNSSVIFDYNSTANYDGVLRSRVEEGLGNVHAQQVDAFIKNGIPVIVVDCVRGGHIDINHNFFKNGFIDYNTGKVSLPLEGYRYRLARWVYDEETGNYHRELEDIDVSKINTKEELYKFIENVIYNTKKDMLFSLKEISINDLAGREYCVRSDYGLLEQRLNNIVGKIRNSIVIQETIDVSAFISSTSKVPQQIPTAVQEYFSMSANLLLSLGSDCGEFAKAGLSIEQMDSEMQNSAENL